MPLNQAMKSTIARRADPRAGRVCWSRPSPLARRSHPSRLSGGFVWCHADSVSSLGNSSAVFDLQCGEVIDGFVRSRGLNQSTHSEVAASRCVADRAGGRGLRAFRGALVNSFVVSRIRAAACVRGLRLIPRLKRRSPQW